MKTSKVLAISAALLTVTVALAGCTPATAPKPVTTSTAKVSTATYTADDLTTIVTAANVTLDAGGNVLTNKQVQSQLAKSGMSGGLSALLSQKGASISPAECGDLLTKVSSTTQKLPTGEKVAIAELTWGTNALTVSTIPGKPLPTALHTDYTVQFADVLSKCGTMTLKISAAGKKVSAKVSVEKVPVQSTADLTMGIKETVSIAGTPVTITVEDVQAIKGNLVINATTLGSDTTSLVGAVNAAVQATK